MTLLVSLNKRTIAFRNRQSILL